MLQSESPSVKLTMMLQSESPSVKMTDYDVAERES